MGRLLPILDTCQLLYFLFGVGFLIFFFFFFILRGSSLVGGLLKHNSILQWCFEIISASVLTGLILFCADILSFNTSKFSSSKVVCKAVCERLLE